MALLDDTPSTRRKPRPSSKVSHSSGPSSGLDSATLQTIQNLQKQIADLEAKEEERGELTKAQAAKLTTLETELATLKASASHKTASDTEQETPQSDAGRMAPWCPW